MAASDYWGYLVRPDKSPSPVFEQLLLGIANYIVSDDVVLQFMRQLRCHSDSCCDAESKHCTVGYHMLDTHQACCFLPSRWR